MFLVIFDLLLCTTLILTGLIWVIQLVHYPAFQFVDPSRFQDFHRFHSLRISILVVPMMTLQLLMAGFWVYTWKSQASVIFFVLTISLWLATFLISVPIHHRLSHHKDDRWIRKLNLSNWIRTALWTIQSIFLVVLRNHQFFS